MKNSSIPFESDINWSEFEDDRARIKSNSLRFKNKSVIEAFQEVYKVDLTDVDEKANDLPHEYNVGDIIKTRIASVSKGSVKFDNINYKGTVNCAVNLYKYPKLRGGVDQDVDAIITDVKKDRITVDPIKPMTASWIKNVVSNPWIQNVMGNPQTIKVRNLQWTSGGFTGKAVVPTTSEFVGEEVLVDAFIPGSHIVLNITDDFNKFVGKDVDAFVLNYIQKDDSMSLICSVKSYLTFLGYENLIERFNRWCEDSPLWNVYSQTIYEGSVTGVINSSKKCGVFIEVPDLLITGMAKVSPEMLVNYKPNDKVKVRLSSFDEETFYNRDAQQVQHVDPYVIEDGVLVKCNLKPILAIVE